jgi:NAD-dependent dihydropyrimidine dehydrogenase PreA subunit
MTVRIRIDLDRCKQCLNCVRVCTTFDGVYEEGPDGYPVVARPEECVQCLICHTVCPTNAITHEGHHETTLINPDEKLAERYRNYI